MPVDPVAAAASTDAGIHFRVSLAISMRCDSVNKYVYIFVQLKGYNLLPFHYDKQLVFMENAKQAFL